MTAGGKLLNRIGAALAVSGVAGLVLACSPQSAGASVTATHYRVMVPLVGIADFEDPGNYRWRITTGAVYEILGQDDQHYRIRIIRCGCKGGAARSPDELEPSEKVYLVKKDRLKAEPLYREVVQSVDVGAVAVPWKVRPSVPGSSFHLAGDAALGTGIGYRFVSDHSWTSWTPVLFVGASQAALAKEGTSSVEQKLAVTLAIGLQIEVPRNIKLGTFVGWDRVGDDAGEAWPHQGRPWYSLGINFALFKRETSDF